jgi:hypothetical protein
VADTVDLGIMATLVDTVVAFHTADMVEDMAMEAFQEATVVDFHMVDTVEVMVMDGN